MYELIKRDLLRDFCAAYQQAMSDIEAGLALIEKATERMKPMVEHFSISQGADYIPGVEAARERALRCTWYEIIRRTGVRDVMTDKRRRDLNEQLERGELPPITVENVESFLEGLRGTIGDIVRESIEVAARILRPDNGRYKTNGDGWQLGDRAITEWGVSWCKYLHRLDLNYHKEADINAVDNAFHLLDGKGPAKYPDNLVTKIREVIATGGSEVTTQYFRVKMYKNGNLHWEFLRPDLVNELNAKAATHRELRAPAA